MGPRGLVASYLHWYLTPPAGQTDRRAGRAVAGRAESRLRDRRGRDRQRAAGAGPGHDLVFTDRVIATLVILRFQLPHAAVALFYGVDRSTITRAVHEIRPLLAQRGFAGPGAGRSSPGRRSKTPSSQRSSATATAGCCGRARPVPAGCTTSPRCAARASKTCSAPIHRSGPRPTPATKGWPAISPARSAPRPRSHPKTPHPSSSLAMSNAARPSPHGGSASSTPSPSPSSGGPCSATSDAANTSNRPCTPSPHWSPTAAPTADDHQPGTPGQHVRGSIVHNVVRAGLAGKSAAEFGEYDLEFGVVRGVNCDELTTPTARRILGSTHVQNKPGAQELERDPAVNAVIRCDGEHIFGIVKARGNVDLPALPRWGRVFSGDADRPFVLDDLVPAFGQPWRGKCGISSAICPAPWR